MADAPYLVALALVDKSGQRFLPLAGKSLSAEAATSADPAADPGEDGRTLALELLLRLWQGSDGQSLRRAAGDPSLLLVELPLEVMSEQLPLLKAQWIASGDTPAFLARLQALVGRAWRITIARYEPLTFVAWP